MEQSVTICLLGLLAGILMSMPFGPTAVVIISEAYFRDLESGFAAMLAPITIDVLVAIAVLALLGTVSGFLISNQGVLQIIAAIAVFAIAYNLRWSKTEKLQKSIPMRHVYLSTLWIAKVNLLTAPIAFVLTLPGIGNGILIASLPMRFLFIGSMALGSICWWAATLIFIDYRKANAKEPYDPEKLKLFFTKMIMLLLVLVECQGLYNLCFKYFS